MTDTPTEPIVIPQTPAQVAETMHRDLTHTFDDDHWFPFVEDENANITGPLHQDQGAFAAAVNRYDEVCNGQPFDEDDQWEPDDIAHRWVTLNPDGESFTVVAADAPGAFPVTTIWGQR